MRNAVAAPLVLSLLLALGLSPARLTAADVNSVTLKGNVVQMDILTSGPSHAYVETLLYVWDYDSPSTPLQAVLVRCNGAAGGSLANCLYPSAFCSTSTHTHFSDIYESSLVTDRYVCNPASSRQSGECVDLSVRIRPLDIFIYNVFADGHSKSDQALSLDVTDVNYGTSCTSK